MNLMRVILGLEKEEGRKSNYLIALESARRLTGRNPLDGTAKCIYDMRFNLLNINKILNEHALNEQPVDEKMMIGITMYLILLDLIGCLFERSGKSVSCKNGIKKALALFSDFENNEISAIVDLRNSLAHNFGLAPDKRNDKKKNKFTLSFSDGDKAITLPTKSWNGNYSDKKDDSSTKIGVYDFCNEIEHVVTELTEVYNTGKLEFNKEMSEDEIKARFTILI